MMATIPKSIRTLQFQLSKRDSIIGPGLKDACRLGIEALKIVRFARQNNYHLPHDLMPGEE